MPSAPATPSPLPSPIVAGLATPQPGTIYLGAFANPSGLAHGSGPSDTAVFESQIGRKLALDLIFSTFTTKFGGRTEQDDFANGRLPIYSWNCGSSNAQLAAGTLDDSIRLQADSVRAYGWPVFVRYMWDMNLPSTAFSRTPCYDPQTDNQGGRFSATAFVAAWQHIRQIFSQEGATNAVWLWSVSAQSTNALAYYPGASQVDWVGIDAYDLTSTDFQSTFSTMYGVLASLGKPMMISETGANSATQSSFFGQAVPALQSQFPLVKGFVYYDGIGVQDWRITPAAMPAFSAFANNPYMAARYAP